MIKIVKTPKSITIIDADRNIVTVVLAAVTKTTKRFDFHSQIVDQRKNKAMLQLQERIKHVLSQKVAKDSYEVRFNKLARLLNSLETHSFVTMANALKPKAPNTAELAAA